MRWRKRRGERVAPQALRFWYIDWAGSAEIEEKSAADLQDSGRVFTGAS
jgi:hypothetical protein